MKKALFSLAVAGLLTASANAATLSLQWQGQPGVDKISLAPSDTAVIDVILQTSSFGLDSISGVFFSMEAGPVEHVSNSAALPGWSAGGAVNLPFGLSQFAVGSNAPGGPDDISGAGTFLIGSFVIHYNDLVSPLGTQFEVAFDAALNNQIVRSDGAFYTFVTDASAANLDYSGYWTFGKGSPGLVTMMVVTNPRDPLIITKVPEPASLALLALGGFAAIMRRRN